VKDERLQMRINSKLKEQAEKVAKRRNMSLTALIVHLLTHAVEADQLARQVQQEADQI
jgi:antitoxin component of RelBE/YafQ-DinJ toxin-antitoxin module